MLVLTFKSMSRRTRLFLWFTAIILIFLAVTLSILGIFSLIVSPEEDGGTILYKHGTGARRDPSFDAARSLYCPDGVPYVNFSLMANACGFSISGDETEIRYLIETKKGAYDTVIFYYGSAEVSVNGSFFMLSHKVIKNGTSVLVPAEFVTRCMTGVTVTVNRDSITVVYDIGNIALSPHLDPLDPITPIM